MRYAEYAASRSSISICSILLQHVLFHLIYLIRVVRAQVYCWSRLMSKYTLFTRPGSASSLLVGTDAVPRLSSTEFFHFAARTTIYCSLLCRPYRSTKLCLQLSFVESINVLRCCPTSQMVHFCVKSPIPFILQIAAASTGTLFDILPATVLPQTLSFSSGSCSFAGAHQITRLDISAARCTTALG
jgi:hypothetical protein